MREWASHRGDSCVPDREPAGFETTSVRTFDVGSGWTQPVILASLRISNNDNMSANISVLRDLLLFRDNPDLCSDLFNMDDISFYYAYVHWLIY